MKKIKGKFSGNSKSISSNTLFGKKKYSETYVEKSQAGKEHKDRNTQIITWIKKITNCSNFQELKQVAENWEL